MKIIFFTCFTYLFLAATPLSGAENPYYDDKDFLSKFSIAAGLSVPEIISIEAYYRINPSLKLKFYGSPPTTREANITIDERQLGSAFGYKAVTEEQDIKFDVNFGPHMGLDAVYHPINASKFYISFGMGVRFLDYKTDDQYRIFICSASETTCSEDSSITSPVSVDVKGSMKSTSYLARVSLGWHWFLTENFFINFMPIGIAKPIYTDRSAELDSNLSTAAPSIFDNILNTFLQNAVDEGESEAEDDAEDKMAPYDMQPHPIIGVTVGYDF